MLTAATVVFYAGLSFVVAVGFFGYVMHSMYSFFDAPIREAVTEHNRMSLVVLRAATMVSTVGVLYVCYTGTVLDTSRLRRHYTWYTLDCSPTGCDRDSSQRLIYVMLPAACLYVWHLVATARGNGMWQCTLYTRDKSIVRPAVILTDLSVLNSNACRGCGSCSLLLSLASKWAG